jgi:hypothetical protein
MDGNSKQKSKPPLHPSPDVGENKVGDASRVGENSNIGAEMRRIEAGGIIKSPCVKLTRDDIAHLKDYAQKNASYVEFVPFPPEPYRTYYTRYHNWYFSASASIRPDEGICCYPKRGVKVGPLGI